MELAKEVTGFWPGCRGRHALSAASFPVLRQAHESRQIQYRELPNAMQVAAIRSDVVKVSIFPPFTDEIIQKIISAPILAGRSRSRRDTNQSQGRKPTTRRPRFHLR